MKPNQECSMTMRCGLALSALALAFAVVSTASAQIPPYNPSNPVAVGTNSILVWNLDQGSGTTATDSANPVLGGDNAGTLNGAGVTWTNSAKFAGGLNFAGTNAVGYVTAPITGSLLANAEVCMSAWIRPTAGAAPDGSFILGWSGPGGAGAFVRVNGGGTSIATGFKMVCNGVQWVETSAVVDYASWLNTWHHVAGTVKKGVVSLYIDGVLVGRNSNYAGAAPLSPDTFVAGAVAWDPTYTSANYEGDLDDVRLVVQPHRPILVSTEFSPDPSTVVLWHMNENTGTTTDDAATPVLDGANNGTITANTTWTTGKFGAGLNGVTGDSGYVSTTLSSGLFAAQQITMDAWIKPTAIDDGGSYIMGFDDGAGGSPFSFIRLNSGTSGGVGFKVSSSGEQWADVNTGFGGVNVLDGNWHHIAGTFNSGVVRMYLDGALIGIGSTYAGAPLAGTPGRFAAAGSVAWDFGYTGANYIGDIDEVRLSNLARSDFGLAYTPTPPTPAPTSEFWPDANTVVLWHMNENTGASTADAATPVLDGANNGTITANTTWTTGRFGAGLNAVSGDSGYVSTTLSSGLFTNQQITMEAWIKPTAIDDGGSYVMGYDNGSGGGPFSFIRLSSGTSGGVGFQVKLNTTTMYAQVNPSFGAVNVLDGNWHHIAGTLNDGVVCMYVDGVLVGTNATYMGWTLPGEPVRFGVAGSVPWDFGYTGVNYIGDIDEVRLSNIARTSFVTPSVSIAGSGSNVVVTYAGILQSATAVTGPYTDIEDIVSPYTNSVSGSLMFFRSRAP